MLASLAFVLQQAKYEPYVAPASNEGEAAIARLKVPDGFEAKLWAAEPHLANPVAMYVDAKGEVYVAETFRLKSGVDDIRDHMDWLDDDVAARTVEDRVRYLRNHLGEQFEADYTKDRERLRWIGDTDGDGRADKSTVFADDFHTTADGIAAGVLATNGHVYFACMPSLWDLSDGDGDHVADAKRLLSTGYGIRFALIGHDLHGLRIGPDGKLYFSCGDRGLSVPLSDGTRLQNQFNGAVLRCNLDGSELEIFATGLRNPQELVFDEYGELWTCDNNSDGGDRARLVHVIEGMDAGWRQSYQWLTEPNLRGPWNDEGLWKPHFEGQAAYIVPPLANICDGPSGLTYNPGTALGPEWKNHFFVCDFRGDASNSGIQTFTVKPKGASFELDEFEHFVWGTLATDCDFGPDGALWWSDWVEGWGKTGKGRIYRLVPKAPLPRAPTFDSTELVRADWSKFEDSYVRGALVSDDQRVRFAAQFELVKRNKKQVLLRLAQDPTATTLARVHAVWGLGQLLGGASDELVRSVASLTTDSDPHVRAQAFRVLGDRRRWEAMPDLQAALTDPDPVVQRYAANFCGRTQTHELDHGGFGPNDGLVALLQRVGESDPALRSAAVFALSRSTEPEILAQLAKHESKWVRTGAVLALRRHRSELVARFLDYDDPALATEAARAIYDVPIEAAYPALAKWIERGDMKTTALVRRVLNANFRLGSNENASLLSQFAAREDADELHRWEALDLLSKWAEPPGRDGFTGEWWPLPKRDASFLPRLVTQMRECGIEEAPPRVAIAWIELAAQCRATNVAPWLLEIARDTKREVDVRVAAVHAAEKLRAPQLDSALNALINDAESKVRAAALGAVNSVAPEKAFPLLEKAAVDGSRDERRVAYEALAKLSDPRVDELLSREVAKLAGDLIPAEVALDLVLAAEKRGAKPVTQALEALRAPRKLDSALAPFIDGLQGGSFGRGKKVFREKHETECLRCHKTEWGEGGQVGPDLRGVGQRLSRVEILASIVDPNRHIARGYDNVILFHDDGKALAGVIVEESAEVVKVRTNQDELVELDARGIENRRPDLSAMPQDVSKHLSREEMRDLIEYLATLEEPR